VAAFGGQRYWKDGRDVYDVIMGLLDYPETPEHGGFTLSLQTNFEDGGGGDTSFRFVGSDGVISVSFTELTLNRTGIVQPRPNAVLKGYNSARTFSNAEQQRFAEKYLAERAAASGGNGERPRQSSAARAPDRFKVPAGYDERFDHFVNFFRSVREGKPVYEDAVFGLRAAAPALLCNDSYRNGRVIAWDPVAMKVVS
jgi:hypothetical protein